MIKVINFEKYNTIWSKEIIDRVINIYKWKRF